jgi:hypothetical protein
MISRLTISRTSRKRRDTDPRTTQPEMREDALATLATLRDAFHDPAPDLRRRSRRPRGQGAAHAVKVGEWRTKPAHTAMWARRTLTVCDHLIGGDVQEQIRRCVFVQHYMTQGTVMVEL